MSCGLSREVLKWILSLDLSYPVKNPKRDFANGFLYAEILSRYYPADVQMHSYENVASMERKKSNWALLEKVIKRKRIPIERTQIEAVMAADGDAAVEVLQAIFTFIHSPSYEASKAQAGTAGTSPEQTPPRDRGYDASTSGQPDYVPLPGMYEQQQQMYGQMPGAMYFGGGGGAGGYAAAQQQQQQQQQQPAASGMYRQQYPQAVMGMAQPQQLQQQLSNGYSDYAQQQPQYGGQAAAIGMPEGYGYGYSYAAQQQQQQPQAPGRGGGGPPTGGYADQAAQQRTRAGQQQQSQQRSSVPPEAGGSPGGMPAAAPVAAGGGYAAAYALAYAEQMRQQAVAAGYTPDQQQLVYQQALFQYQQQAAVAAMAGGGAGAAAAANDNGNNGNGQDSPEREGLPYSRKPRPVEFKPYDIKDFEDKEYNVKAGRGYWQLGKLGPDLETEELQAKREAKERIKKMGEQVREENARKANSRPRQRPADSSPTGAAGSSGAGAAAPAASAGSAAAPGAGGGGSNPSAATKGPDVGRERGKEKELSARERAMQFAKNIPKPEPKPKKAPAAQQGDAAPEPPQLSELELLERQHQERQQEVDKIRAELARIL